MKNQIKVIVVLLCTILLSSCKEKTTYSKMNTPMLSEETSVHKIIIKEYKDGGSYAYLNVEENGNEYWMAVPGMSVIVGGTYYYEGGMIMKDFESKQLNKTFDFITFAEGIRTTEVAQSNTHVVEDANHVHQTGEQIFSEVKAEMPENGIWIKDLFASKEKYANKEIIVRGKVVKVNEAILGRNWVHLVDGTARNGEKDLTITTNDKPSVGFIYNFKGKVILDKDFGQGYTYKIMLEEATLIK